MASRSDSAPQGVRHVPAWQLPAGGGAPVRAETPVVAEDMLRIQVADVGWYGLMWTPTAASAEVLGFTRDDGVLAATDDPELLALVAGFLFSEGLIRELADVRRMEACVGAPGTVSVVLSDPQRARPRRRDVAVTSSCGVCGDGDGIGGMLDGLVPVGQRMCLGREQFGRLMGAMRELQTVFDQTGGAHAAAVFDAGAGILALAEDLGRHNALDKVIGQCLLRGQSPAGCGVLLSSRLSLEMVCKAVRAGLEVVAAVSAPTSLAVETAERFGVTLCGFVRGGRATIFSHPQRIAELQELVSEKMGSESISPGN